MYRRLQAQARLNRAGQSQVEIERIKDDATKRKEATTALERAEARADNFQELYVSLKVARNEELGNLELSLRFKDLVIKELRERLQSYEEDHVSHPPTHS